MSNFTKSIFYSGAVLAVAMIAVFSIYTNMTQADGDMAAMEPAAGEETMMQEGALGQAGDYITNTATDAAEAAKGIAAQAIENAATLSQDAGEAVSDAAATADATMKDTMEAAADVMDKDTPAENAAEAIEAAAEDAAETTEDAAEEASEMAKDMANEAADAMEPAAGSYE